MSYNYNVTITSSDGTTLQGPFTTNDTTYTFMNVEALFGILNVAVFAFIGDVRGDSVTQTAIVSSLSRNG